MNEITKVILENEMDLILVHKQSMRLAELASLTLPAQTTFATAVSEVCRSAMGMENDTVLTLYVSDKKEKIKYLTAVLEDKRQGFLEEKDEGYKYAKKLIPNIHVASGSTGNRTELNYRLASTLKIDDATLGKWRNAMNTDPSVSPYEEIKRKNRQLVEMADKLRQSEQQYKLLTDSLPIMIFSIDDNSNIIYANKWVYDYTGQTLERLNKTKWKDAMHPDEYNAAWKTWDKDAINPDAIIARERRFKNAQTGEYRWHTGVSIAIKDDEGHVKCWNTFMVDIHAQKMIEETLKDNKQLQEIRVQLEEKINQLNKSNEQLEQFAYVTSHDLQEPLRKISFYSDFIKNKFGQLLPDTASVYFDNLINSTERMKMLIQDILAYSTVRKDEFAETDLSLIAAEALKDLEVSIEEKKAQINISALPSIEGNPRQLRQLFENLFSNSLKFSKAGIAPVITVRAEVEEGNVLISFSDNGIGFDTQYTAKMFDLFQRLQTREKYTGTGIGLSVCKKIVDIHHGSIKASGTPGAGAVFLITLPLLQSINH